MFINFKFQPVQNGVLDDLQLSQFSDELDVSKHFPLGQMLSVLVSIYKDFFIPRRC